MKTTPLISVLLPSGRERDTLPAAVASVLAQTETRFELLLIGRDDVDALAAALPSDPRLRAIARQGEGIVAALNTGLARARGRFVARMDDDDLCHPERFAAQLAHHAKRPGLIGARVRMIDADGRPDGVGAGTQRYADWLNALLEPDDLHHACFIESPLPHPTWFAERALFEQLGGWREGDFPEDHDLVLRAWLAGVALSKPAPVLLDWRDHPDRLTRRDPRYRREAFIRLKASIACHPASGLGLDRGRGVWLAGVGRSARRWCDALLREGAIVHGFVDLAGPRMRKRMRHRPVIDYATLATCLHSELLIGAVTQPAARDAVDAWCRNTGLLPGQDYLLGD